MVGEIRAQIPAGVEIFSTFFRDRELCKLPYCLQFTYMLMETTPFVLSIKITLAGIGLKTK